MAVVLRPLPLRRRRMIRLRNSTRQALSAAILLATATLATAELSQLLYQPDIPLNHPAIRYYESPVHSLTQLQLD